MNIFSIFGSILGYLLWLLYTIFRNYGVAIILFTIILKLVLFPTSVKQQRSMASQARLSEKQKELQKKFANNKQKYNEELAKLYEKEGVSPTSGCVTSLLPLPIMLGIYWSVIQPLSNTLHISSEAVKKATDYISRIPGVVSSTNTLYSELQIIHSFDALRDNLTMFNAQEIEKIADFSKGFKFLGLDLLATPQGSSFSTFLWLIPVLSLVSGFAYQIYMIWYQKKTTGQSQTGCMLAMAFVFPIISLYWAYTMPAAVGFYWVISSLTSWAQSIITNRFFSAQQMTAMNEARRAAALELAEQNIRPLPAVTQKEIADRLNAAAQQKQTAKETGKQQKQSQKKKRGGQEDSSAYIGSKK